MPNLRNKVLDVKPGVVDFYLSEGVLSSSVIDRSQGGAVQVAADGISDVIENYCPTAIVMDVEGAEIELLRCCSLECVSKMVIEMHPHVVGEEKGLDLCRYLTEMGLPIKKRQRKVYLFER